MNEKTKHSETKLYIVQGVLGRGKTSLIHALASTCDLDIYVVSLATAGYAPEGTNERKLKGPLSTYLQTYRWKA